VLTEQSLGLDWKEGEALLLRIRHGLRRITETASVCVIRLVLNEGWVDVGPIVVLERGEDPARNKRSLLCHRLCHDLGAQWICCCSRLCTIDGVNKNAPQ